MDILYNCVHYQLYLWQTHKMETLYGYGTTLYGYGKDIFNWAIGAPSKEGSKVSLQYTSTIVPTAIGTGAIAVATGAVAGVGGVAATHGATAVGGNYHPPPFTATEKGLMAVAGVAAFVTSVYLYRQHFSTGAASRSHDRFERLGEKDPDFLVGERQIKDLSNQELRECLQYVGKLRSEFKRLDRSIIDEELQDSIVDMAQDLQNKLISVLYGRVRDETLLNKIDATFRVLFAVHSSLADDTGYCESRRGSKIDPERKLLAFIRGMQQEL